MAYSYTREDKVQEKIWELQAKPVLLLILKSRFDFITVQEQYINIF